MRAVRDRIGLVLLGLVLGFVALEVLLQGLALGRRLVGRAGETSTAAESATLLAVGDSNTYGLYCDANEAYPIVLGTLWNARPGAPRLRVVNAGYPGTNSSVLLSKLPELLERTRPRTVTILAGINDAWTEPVDQARLDDPGGESALWRWSRVYRLLYMLRQSVRQRYERVRFGDPVDPDAFLHHTEDLVVDGKRVRLGWTQRPTPAADWGARLDANLDALVAQVREHGAEPVLLTYAAGGPVSGKLNTRLRAAAARTGARLIDVATVFGEGCPDEQCAELLFPDGHPTPAGHRLLAQTMLAQWDGWARGATPAP
jgi:lysophospholipase L1-like esterase